MNTHSHQFLPLTRTDASSEQTTGLASPTFSMAAAASSSGSRARARMLQIAPSPIDRPKSSPISVTSRSMPMACAVARSLQQAHLGHVGRDGRPLDPFVDLPRGQGFQPRLQGFDTDILRGDVRQRRDRRVLLGVAQAGEVEGRGHPAFRIDWDVVGSRIFQCRHG